MASFRAIPLGNYTLGPPRLPRLIDITGAPFIVMLSGNACCSACIFVICSNLRHFNRFFIFVDRKTSQGAWSGEYGVGGQPACCFGLKIAERTMPRGLARCRYAKVSPVYAGCVGVFS